MTAFTSSVGQMGGITSALIFPESDGPYYVPGVSVCIGLCAAGFVVAGCIWFFNSLENKARDAGRRDHLRDLPRDQQNKLGEKHPDFRYTL
jgi:hypothetical protein